MSGLPDHWRARFLSMARLVASWSKDPSTKVGAVIADPQKRVVSVGYNGLPTGLEDQPGRLKDRDTKLAITLHAEENAILFAQRPLQGCHMFVWPLPPCAQCAAKIVQAGISTVTAPRTVPDRWRENMAISDEILSEAGIGNYGAERLAVPENWE